MKNNKIRRGLMATTTIAGTMVAVASVLGGAAIFASPSIAFAQDYTSGAVIGNVVDASGKPIAGAQVTLKSSSTGLTQTLTTNNSGTFSASGLAAGAYAVSVNAGGFQNYSGSATIVVAQESRLSIVLAATGAPQTVVVRGHRAIQAFTKSTTGLTVDLETLAAQEPVARSITAVTMLAPSSVKGVSGFGDVASIGGGSVAENAYYINGLNITNPDTYIGSARVPFDFYKTVQVQTGGYAAEFGRATGGVINATTKSGTNDFMFAVHGNFEPNSLRSKGMSTIFNDAKIENVANESLTVEAGGPIIKDHLFFYGLYEANNDKHGYAVNDGTYKTDTAKDPFYGGKLDYYITPTQHLELTYFNTKTTDNITSYNFTFPSDLTKPGVIGSAIGGGTEKNKNGGDNWVGKYTGKLTDWFSVSAAYGISNDANDFVPGNPAAYYVLDHRPAVEAANQGAVATDSTTQPFATTQIVETKRKFYRADGDMTFEALGHHHVRFGFDHEDLNETKTDTVNGALPVYYDYRTAGVRITFERLGGKVSGKDSAYYIQDSWDVTSKLTLQYGLRDDEFQQSNLSGQKYLTLKGNWAPRVGFSYDVTGDSTWKVFGNYGVYYIPPAMNLGFRGRDMYFREYFNYPTGTDYTTFKPDPVTGLPTQALGAARTDLAAAGYGSQCPVDISSAPGNPVNGANACIIFGAGVQDPALAKQAVGAKATYENEFILGTSWHINDLWTVGVTGTYRDLKRVSEDTDFAPYLYDYYQCGAATPPAANAGACNFYGNNSAYYIWNPGASSQTLVDWYGATTGQRNLVTITGLKFPVPKRTYKALVFDWKRAFDGKWGLQGSLTLSRSFGNYEGTVKSDAGNGAQADAGSTQDFDYLGLTDYSTGLLPNHHGYELKTWGSYAITPDFLIGANLQIISPMHGSCEGFHPTDPNAAAYGPASFYCNGKPAPRGTGWKSDWEKTLDLSLRYTVPEKMALNGKLVLRADIFNLFNSQAVLQRYAQYELGTNFGDPTNLDPSYLAPTSVQTPRYMRVGFDLTY